ncbi:MAG: hypothetical protein KGR26_02715, partial [Cyanobacteria bacterium REEB65]|nr:hypothetical protein [Cyanobacteria bacterium REEB65]
MAEPDIAEEKPTKRLPALPKLTLPKLQVPKLPKISLPAIDFGILLGGLAIAGISAGAALLAVQVFFPKRVVRIVRDPEAVAVGKSFNRLDVPGFTVGPNVPTEFIARTASPLVDNSAYIHPEATVVGAVRIEAHVLVAPQASIRGDVGQGIYIGEDSGVLDGAVVRGRPTEDHGQALAGNVVQKFGQTYSVYIGERTTLAPQCQVYGPAVVGDDTYIGEQTLVDHAIVGSRCVLEPRSAVIG